MVLITTSDLPCWRDDQIALWSAYVFTLYAFFPASVQRCLFSSRVASKVVPAPVATFRPHSCLRSVTFFRSLSLRTANPWPSLMYVTKSIVLRRSSVTPKLPVPRSYLPLPSAGRIASKPAASRFSFSPRTLATASAKSMSW